jgi:glutathione S-transferase
VLDGHLASNDWLAAGRPTVADVACYPYVALAPEGEISLAPYKNVIAWIARIQALPGYIAMPGIAPAAELG